MAVPSIPTVPNTPLVNVYNDDDNAIVHTRLPTGPCNFTNLSAGPNAPKCGCRRFWDRSAGTPMVYEYGNGRTQQNSQEGWCMCEHHACFHDAGEETGPQIAASGGGTATLRDSVLRQSTELHRVLQPGGGQSRLGALGMDRPQSQGTIPDTLQWGRFVNSESNPGGLPPIPSQCLMQSDNSSIGSVSQSRYSRPFAGLGLNTLSHIPGPTTQGHESLQPRNTAKRRERVMQLYEDSAGGKYLQSLTDVATPSLRSSQNLDDAAAFEKHAASVQASLQKLADAQERDAKITALALRPTSDGSPDPRNSQEAPDPNSSGTLRNDSEDKHLLPQIRSIINHVANYPLTMQNHERRLDLLENASFSNMGNEELQDKHENLDNRVVDLESRVEEVEKAQAALNDASSIIGSRKDGSFNSIMSNTSSAIMASAIDRLEYKSRIEALEAQVSDLHASATPSYQNPWEVEVVFLPFGSRLMGIWSSRQSITQRSRTNSLPSDDWTQTQNNTMAAAQACLTAHEQAAAWEHAASDISDQQEWLMPKACGVRSRVDERLRSRGLVKTIQITGPDARDVQVAMMSTFGDIPAILAEQSSGAPASQIPKCLSQYLGLQAPWVPLRKLHKDSCLRFLNPSEMVTPALWTVPHLKSSVAMRTSATIRRLYVTQPDSYIQHLRDGAVADWTWQKLRELPRVYPNSQSSFQVPEADAQETCWEYDERLDPPPTIHSSFASHRSSLSIRSIQHEEPELTSPSDHFSSAAVSPVISTTPTSVPTARQISPLKERNPFRPIHTRTMSMCSVPIKSSPSQGNGLGLSKRRITSFDHETQSSPIKATHVSSLKRRRISRSPSRPRDTPRWSVGPPSPYNFEDMNVSERKRGNTPFAYATPHSNAPYIDVIRPQDDSDEQLSVTDDLHQDEDYLVGHNYDSASGSEGEEDMGHQPDEEWEGVQDEAAEYESRHGGKSVGHDEEGDDDQSDISSQPSEYPSTQQHAFAISAKGTGFKIHVDEEVYEGGI